MQSKLTICLILLLSTQTLAWWEVGHMMTAQVAKLYLEQQSPETLAWADCLIQDLNKLTDGRSNTFAEAAVWADDIKEPGTNYLDNWHYTDRPINEEGLLIVIDPVEIKYNSVDAMSRARSILINSKTAGLPHTWAKAQMLRYILHIAGDMHQPLHNSNYYNATFKNGDVGGNLIKLKKLDGTLVNLHAFWDSGATLLQPSDDLLVRPLNSTAQAYLETEAQKIMSQFPMLQFSTRDMTNPTTWTQEGYQDAMKYVYPFVESNTQITQEYMEESYLLVQEKIALGGYRLASYLMDIHQVVQKVASEQGFVESRIMNLKYEKSGV